MPILGRPGLLTYIAYVTKQQFVRLFAFPAGVCVSLITARTNFCVSGYRRSPDKFAVVNGESICHVARERRRCGRAILENDKICLFGCRSSSSSSNSERQMRSYWSLLSHGIPRRVTALPKLSCPPASCSWARRGIDTKINKSLAVASIARDVGSSSTNRTSDIMH